MASSNQGGSILSFLIIGGVLTVLLVGGVYAVQRRVANPTSAPTAVQSDAPEKAQAPVADEKKVAVEQNKDAASQEAAKKAEAQKEGAKQEATKPAAPAQVTPPANTELPKTGTAESISAILGLGLLSGVTVAYVKSRGRAVTL